MKFTLSDRLLRREYGDISKYSNLRGIYSDRSWVDDLDIVNELGGHTGCVNALSWSTSGRLLASGSDDQHINVHAYQPESSVAPFSLTTTVATGHMANIFSVKFMPHSGDRTLVSAAGDAEVRVFDIEHSGRGGNSESNIASSLRGARFHNTYKKTRYLTDGNTNARVYRSHANRVKRIVTESSPHHFLTCSEDGEVRQFDLRLPSSAYPPPRGGQGFLAYRADHDNSNVPPPLISYKRFNLDLNTISCSSSQPHYIALGGHHLHCFLHDRRMLGRDLGEERGEPARMSPAASMSSAENELMGQATRCVRKFAPEGRRKMSRNDNGHITACKISDANPNELIASWSGDHIYSFDLLRSPDASETAYRYRTASEGTSKKGKSKESGDRKRKRTKTGSSMQDSSRRSSRRRHEGENGADGGDMALRVRYENGQTEDIAMSDVAPSLPQAELETARELALNESQRRSLRIAKSMVRIRKMIFSLDASRQSDEHYNESSCDPASHTASFTSALGLAASCLPEMDDVSQSWTYPVNPLPDDVTLQSTLRANRDSARRFVQASGTLARLLGGKLQTTGSDASHLLQDFQAIGPTAHEGPPRSHWEIFRYDFLKAIILWLEGGKSNLLAGFKRPATQRMNNPRYPVPEAANENATEEIVIPYLLQRATDTAISDIDTSRFEKDATRQILPSEAHAVTAFAKAINIPFRDSSEASDSNDTHMDDPGATQDWKTALKFWGFKVGRGLLMNAGEGVNFQFTDTAFGGIGRHVIDEDREQENIDPDEEEEVLDQVTLVRRSRGKLRSGEITQGKSSRVEGAGNTADNAEDNKNIRDEEEHHGAIAELANDGAIEDDDEDHDEDQDREDDSGDDDDEDDDDDDEDRSEDEEEEDAAERSFMFRTRSDRARQRERVERDVPCYTHTRQYRGHCNVKTVKDANFFGLQDDYVVSGSDDGNLFIWDRRTSELVNILAGDSEVVNVIQGHPFEPILAVSGIDHTIKIFSADSSAREDAENGLNIGATADDSAMRYSSLSRRRHVRSEENGTRSEGEGLASRKRMQQSYQIVSQNDVSRQGGIRDAYITTSTLAHLAARLRARQGAGADGGVLVGEDGETIVLDENCTVM